MVTDPSCAELSGMRERVLALDPECPDAVRIDRLRLLEELKSAVCAAQAVEAAAFADSQRSANLAAGVPAERAERGVASQLALALRTSPFRAQRYVGWARILTTELTATLASLQAGRTTEWRAMIVARETAWLSREDRARVDAALAPKLEQWGDRRVESGAKRMAYELDPAGAVDRLRHAESERRVTVRPAPDTMCRVTALLPVKDGVAAYASLVKHADSNVGVGDDPRSRSQLMADTFVERLTGRASAEEVAVENELVMSDANLFAPDGAPGRDEPAVVIGHGPVPAQWARDLVLGERTNVWLRRLFTSPGTGQLAAMESTRRQFPKAQRRFVRVRDQTCRTLWCDAAIRHVDHIRPAGVGGRTTVANAAGLCQTCNHAKQAPGWVTRAGPQGETTTITPTGHTYTGDPPDPPSRSNAPPGDEQIAS